MDKNYGNDYFNNPENTANTDNKTDVGSVNNADTSNYGRTDNTTSYSSSAQNPYATSNTAQSSSGTTGYSDNIYSSQGSQAQGSNSSGSGFFDEDGNYRRRYTSTDQPAGSYDAGYSSTRYINNNDTNPGSSQQSSEYPTPPSYYTPT